MEPSPIERVVVVGTGSFGRKRALDFRGERATVAFVSRDLERAREATAALGGPVERATTRLEDALEWGQAVFVATPPALHSEAVLAGVRAGRPVLVEKPVESTLERARALEAACGRGASSVTVAENFAFLPIVKDLARADEGHSAIGALESVSVVVHRPRAPGGWRRERGLAGGGVLADVGVHYVNLLRHLVGELTVERAHGSAILGEGVEAAIAVSGRSRSGVPWEIDLSWAAALRRSEVRLSGARGAFRFRAGKRWLWRTNGWGLPVGLTVRGSDTLGHGALAADWLRAASTGGRGRVSLAAGIEDLEVVDAAYRLAGIS